MDWTNTKEDAAGIEHMMKLRQMAESLTWPARQFLGAATGAVNAVPGKLTPEQKRWTSVVRSEAPVAYRAANYGIPATVGAMGLAAGSPVVAGLGALGLAGAAYDDPLFRANNLAEALTGHRKSK